MVGLGRIETSHTEGIVDPSDRREVQLSLDKSLKVSSKVKGEELREVQTFLRQYEDVFAWRIEDMKGIPARYGEHRIDLLDDAVPIRQRQYRLNPKYSLLVKEEIDKYLSAGIIYPVLSSEWVSPIVIVPKKLTGKIRVCQDFRKLNAATRKDHHPLPFTDAILDHVAGHECYSFLDGFSGYNQVSIREQDKDKTTFTTDWGTYAYHKMPFGLCNAPATFQRMMTNIFQEHLRKFLEIFIDDFCVFGKRKILLGHRVSSSGIAVDTEKAKVILKLEPPTNLRELRAFLGHVGYYRRFIHMYAILAADLTKLLKKDEPYEWGEKQQLAFEALKSKLTTAPVLRSPD
ncbi:hypothetical protein AXG93_2683s1000 [Marchantia polymorpha subsp. ruderalis]|uniref:Reverse transcriptase domain-containing protein n=1 Tax=Marchantia polymorpha subsp. ruderalis TaxID=1480154 RepID=A0A176W9E7_MARPO|nr:hypothetical protein AXG93_2683s1000 [Marchantia polymorpha subsp. ruderalis]